MHKKLLAAAVAGAFVAPAAALAQSTSTVNIYGNLTMEWGVADGGNGRGDSDFNDTPGGSAVGFRGQEKLGGNLSAWFQCESSADIRGMDQSGWCTRNSAVGFKGGFGNVFFGKWDTPFKRAMNVGTVGAEETGILGTSWMAFGGSGGSDYSQNVPGGGLQRQRFKRREAGLGYYESPMFGGFQVLAAVTASNGHFDNAGTDGSFGTPGTSNSHPRVWSIGGIYKAGPLGVGLGYEKHVNFGTANIIGVPPDVDDRGWGASISYTFGGRVEVGATYLDRKWETGPGVHTGKKTSTLGVEWAFAGPHSLHAQWTHAWNTTGSGASIGGNGGATNSPLGDDGGETYSIAYRYSFSKRTSIKFGYVRIENDTNSTAARIGNTPALLGAGQDVDGYAFLIRHRF